MVSFPYDCNEVRNSIYLLGNSIFRAKAYNLGIALRRNISA